ncbi:MAG: protease-4 [Flavobacteriales bacterium]|jgi:protease-4
MFSLLKRYLKFLGKILSWTRIAIVNLVFIVLIVVFFQAISDAPTPEVAEKSALKITFSGRLVEQSTYNPTALDVVSNNKQQPETVVFDVIRAIRLAEKDEQITGLILQLDFLHSAPIAKVEEIGQAINDFKRSEKPVIAYADSMMQSQYLLASYADQVYLHNFGNLYLTGFGIYRNYYKDATDKIALTFNVFKAGQFKDAVEPFIQTGMSDASREHNSAWLNRLWARFTENIERERSLPAGSVQDYIVNFDRNITEVEDGSSQLALQNGFIDGLYSRNELKNKLIESFGTRDDDDDDDKKLNKVGYKDYLSNPMLALKASKNTIGLVVATGTIYDGEHDESNIGGESFSRLLRQAGKDDDLKALVIRVDSGGGSAFASELIRDEIQKLRDDGIKIYVSMSSVAASGGYWLAMAADEIWASPATITGSIGVWALIPNVSGSLQKLGINSDGIATTPLASAMDISREMSPEVKRIFQSGVDQTYARFIKLVAAARDMSYEDVDAIAQGRVWDGVTAHELGLVDNLGSLADVIKAAADAQSYDDYSVKWIKRELSPQEAIVKTLMEQTQSIGNSVASQIQAAQFLPSSLLPKSLSKDLQTMAKLQQSDTVKIIAKCWECSEL